MGIRQHLEAIFDADRSLRESEVALFQTGGPEAVAELLSGAVDEALALEDREEATMRLERLADLCAQVPGAAMADALVRILNDEEPAVRVAAGEALLDVGYERYAEVARAVERALEGAVEGPAMTELPWVIAEIGEPSALSLIRRFLAHPDVEAVGAGIEALAQLGDTAAIEALEELVDDDRTVALEGLDDDPSASTVGDLAEAAIEELGGRS